MEECQDCHHDQLISIDTYKRTWFLCPSCGNARPCQKSFYSLSFLPNKKFKKDKQNPEDMYDYFVQDVHIQHSQKDAKRFFDCYVHNRIDIKNKDILDISGGNGHFIHFFQQHGARVFMTEMNQKAIDYAQKKLDIPSFYYDFQKHRLSSVITQKFDIIMLRAAIMFCRDLDGLVTELKNCLNENGMIIIEHSVEPTLGVLTRVQCDEFSYEILRQPHNVIKLFERHGFQLEKHVHETDPTLYVYDHDLLNGWLFLHYLYELKGVLRLRKHLNLFAFRARDRRRSVFFFVK